MSGRIANRQVFVGLGGVMIAVNIRCSRHGSGYSLFLHYDDRDLIEKVYNVCRFQV
jgi:hypothetical protein